MPCGLCKPSVILTGELTRTPGLVFMAHYLFLWHSNCMEKLRYESVVLSSTEAEYIGVSEVVSELQFINQLLRTMNIKYNFQPR